VSISPTPRHSTWPALDYEEVEWEPRRQFAGSLANAMRGRYRSAIPPEIAGLDPSLTPDLRAIVALAETDISRFDSELTVEIAPFAAILLRSESSASSEIEQLTASAKAVLMAEAGDRSRQNASTVAANTKAMRAAIALADNVDAETILTMHKALLGGQHDWAGMWRTEPVWIGGGSFSPHNATFVPPTPPRVPQAINDLVRFIHRTDLSPLTQTLIAHAQFETIHPFPDGNGRTGRALIQSMLRMSGLTRRLTVPLSAGLLADTDGYFAALGAYREGNVEPIVRVGALAAAEAAGNGRQLERDIIAVRDSWRVKVGKVRSHSVLGSLVEGLVEHPVVDARSVADRYEVSFTVANDAIQRLADCGVLSRANAGLKFRKWIAADVADALDAFAVRAGRRSRPNDN
jgi:Fic family protein